MNYATITCGGRRTRPPRRRAGRPGRLRGRPARRLARVHRGARLGAHRGRRAAALPAAGGPGRGRLGGAAPPPAHRGTECTSSTARVRTVGSVSGSTPWPRLNTCPGAARPSASTRRTSASTTGQSASSSAGSRLPAPRGPARPGRRPRPAAPASPPRPRRRRPAHRQAARRCRRRSAPSARPGRPARRAPPRCATAEPGVVPRDSAPAQSRTADRGRAGLDLPAGTRPRWRQRGQQRRPQVRRAVHERPGARVLATGRPRPGSWPA